MPLDRRDAADGLDRGSAFAADPAAQARLGDIEALSCLPHFRGVPRVTLELLAAAAPTERFLRGETVLGPESRPDCVFVLLSGRVELWMKSRFERRLDGVVGPGGALGDLALTTDAPFGRTAIAASELEALRLGRAVLDRLFASRPEFGLAFARAAASAAEVASRSR